VARGKLEGTLHGKTHRRRAEPSRDDFEPSKMPTDQPTKRQRRSDRQTAQRCTWRTRCRLNKPPVAGILHDTTRDRQSLFLLYQHHALLLYGTLPYGGFRNPGSSLHVPLPSTISLSFHNFNMLIFRVSSITRNEVKLDVCKGHCPKRINFCSKCSVKARHAQHNGTVVRGPVKSEHPQSVLCQRCYH